MEYRVSLLGACPRALLALRLGQTPAPPPEWALDILQEAQEEEDWVARKLKLTERQREVRWEGPGFCVVGHIDGLKDGKLVEVKNLGLRSWERIYSGSVPERYLVQISWYMEILGKEYWPGTLYVRCRDNGRVLEKVFREPPFSLPDLVKRILEVEDWAKRGEAPKCPVPYGDLEKMWCPISCWGSLDEGVDLISRGMERIRSGREMVRRGKRIIKVAGVERVEGRGIGVVVQEGKVRVYSKQ